MIRFLADANLNQGIVAGCLRREPTMDFMSEHQARLEGLSDLAVLALTADQDPRLHDFQTMPHQFAAFVQARGSSPGVASDSAISARARGNRRACSDLERFECRGVGGPHSENPASVELPVGSGASAPI